MHAIVVDGHDVEALNKAFFEASTITGKPTAIVAKTIKGKGIPGNNVNFDNLSAFVRISENQHDTSNSKYPGATRLYCCTHARPQICLTPPPNKDFPRLLENVAPKQVNQ